jgi:hypothetical protein
MLVAYRLAGLAALEGHYPGPPALASSSAAMRSTAGSVKRPLRAVRPKTSPSLRPFAPTGGTQTAPLPRPASIAPCGAAGLRSPSGLSSSSFSMDVRSGEGRDAL